MPTEAWMRGPLEGVDPLLAPVLYTFTQAREELTQLTQEMSTDDLWRAPGPVATVGFHIRHIAGSTERLMTYAQGRQLTPEQLAAMEREKTPGASREELLGELERSFRSAEAVVRQIDVATLREPRGIGRKQLPTTVVGLLVHIAEHIQRHLGQATTTARLVKGEGGGAEAGD